jgi:uncharacterized SAM-binding protein YcdF (DUF218 family)
MEMSPFFFGLYKLVKYAVYPLTWILACLVTAFVITWLPYSPRRQRWLRRMVGIGFLVLFLCAAPIASYSLMSVLESWYPPPSSLSGRFDAIVVLGGGVRGHGTLRPTVELSEESLQRTSCGVDLYQRQAAGRLVMTGGDAQVFGNGPREAPAMKAWAVRLGVPSDAIVIDDQARTTYENALGTKQVLRDATSILLVTSAYHLPRAAALFKKQGFEVTPYPCGFHARHHLTDELHDLSVLDFLPNSRAFNRMTEAVEEAAGIALYWLVGKL